MFKDLDYQKYLERFPFYKKFGISDEELKGVDLGKKNMVGDPYYAVRGDISEPYEIEFDDLIRLHYLITSRKVMTILEFGLGKSTVAFDDALEQNKKHYGDFVKQKLRRSNAFEVYSVDDDEKWLDYTQKTYKFDNAFLHYSPTTMDTFNGRICTFYEKLPNICPDFIYLDGPGLYQTKGELRGISMAHLDRVPMAADILAIEHFLLSGTLIAVDGRTANARFLKANLQRKWEYSYFESYDQHFFELKEAPLGVWNKRQIEFCLGNARGGGIEVLAA